MDIDFQKRLLATFRDETREHLDTIADGLLALEKSASPETRKSVLETVFREAHSLKGAARAVGIGSIESLSHAMEGVFSGLISGDGAASPALFDLLHRAADTISKLVPSAEPGGGDSGTIPVRELIHSLEQAFIETVPPPASAVPNEPPVLPFASKGEEPREYPQPEKAIGNDTIRVSVTKLDSILRQAEEMLTVTQAAQQRAVELKEIETDLAAWEKEWRKIRPSLRRTRKPLQPGEADSFKSADVLRMGKLLAYCEWSQDALKSLRHKLRALSRARANDRRALELMVESLVGDLKESLLLPGATVLGLLPKMVRDLARERGKQAGLTIEGGDVEIDRRILEEIKTPLIHLIRNCVDHGIETVEERLRSNKPAEGAIRVAVTILESNLVEIVVSDDGAGIDTGKLAEMAARQGIVGRDPDGRMETEELMGLIFRSGFSTAPLITDISGRGLGLAIVREKVESLGGAITVSSEAGRGTAFRMVLPLTLATCRGVLLSSGGQTFIVPSAGVEQVARIDRSGFKTVENRESIDLGGAALAFVWLSDVLGLQRSRDGVDQAGMVSLFVVGSGASRIAFGVDAVIGEQEILMKGLGPQLPRVRNIAGATVLGTGKVAAILHPGDLVKSALHAVAAGVATTAAEPEAIRKSVLIAEDSITARTLLKNILEAAGYRTTTAVDGIDALTLLRSGEIDLLVSDVDMPRMNGFELTSRIRSSREFADLPVVLVTSLDSREDRERGIEVGANAYIIKSSFDQSNLVEVIKRLI